MNFYEKLGDKIKVSRKQKGINQETLGELSGLSRTSIVNIEKGRQAPSIERLVLFARILDTNVALWLNNDDLIDMIPKSTIEVLENNHPEISKEVINFLIAQNIKSSD